MSVVKLLPGELIDKLIKKVLRKQKDMQIQSKIIEMSLEAGAQDRTLLLKIDNVGTYHFIMTDSGINYVEKGFDNPTATARMGEDTFLDIYDSKISAWTAWKHGLVVFEATDQKPLYHITILLEMFNGMRKVLGM